MFRFPFSTGIRQVVQTGDATPKFLKNEQRSFAVNNPYALSVTSGSITGCLTSLYSISKLIATKLQHSFFPVFNHCVCTCPHNTTKYPIFIVVHCTRVHCTHRAG